MCMREKLILSRRGNVVEHSNIISKVFAAFILAALVLAGPGSVQPATAHQTAPQSPQPAEPGPAADTSPIYTAISAGFDHSCAVTVTGGAKCWGDNYYGKLGIGIDVDVAWYPFNVVGMTSGVSAIQAGYMHTCVLVNGGVKCWGKNYSGQLGDGTFTDRTTPGFVIGLTSGVSAISSKGNHACALVNGGVFCWGDNFAGQLGNGSTTKSNKPVAVTDLSSGVKAISAGINHTCALLDSGEMKCWGYNLNGQLGNGTNGVLANSSVPVTVASLSNAAAISVGEMHTTGRLLPDIRHWLRRADCCKGGDLPCSYRSQSKTSSPSFGSTTHASALRRCC